MERRCRQPWIGPELGRDDATIQAMRPLHLVGFLAALLACTPATAIVIVGTIGRIQDGDSFFVVEGGALAHEVRLAAIDAPEKGQPYSRLAREHLRQLTAGRLLLVEARHRDRYGRWIATVLADGEDVGLAQLQAGLAWYEERYATEQSPQSAHDYAAAQALARSARTGLWRQSRPTPPWQWRKSRPR